RWPKPISTTSTRRPVRTSRVATTIAPSPPRRLEQSTNTSFPSWSCLPSTTCSADGVRHTEHTLPTVEPSTRFISLTDQGSIMVRALEIKPIHPPFRFKQPSVLPGFGISMGVTLLYLTLLVLIPLGGLVLFAATRMTLAEFWDKGVADPRVLASYRLSFGA